MCLTGLAEDLGGSVLTNEDMKQWPHLKDVNTIGSDEPEALCQEEPGKRNQPLAMKTILGRTVMGPIKGRTHQNANIHTIHVDQALGCQDDVEGIRSIQRSYEICTIMSSMSPQSIRRSVFLSKIDRRKLLW